MAYAMDMTAGGATVLRHDHRRPQHPCRAGCIDHAALSRVAALSRRGIGWMWPDVHQWLRSLQLLCEKALAIVHLHVLDEALVKWLQQ